MRLRAIIVCAALTVAGDAAAQTPAVVDNPLAHYTRETARERFDYDTNDSPLYRITRDYNNDGRLDTALVSTDMCGAGSFSTGCPYELYLRLPDGRWKDVGGWWMHAETADLETVSPGVTRLMSCQVTREGGYYIAPWRISEDGVTNDPSIELTEAQYNARCVQLPPLRDFTLEQCSMRDYLHTGRCDWKLIPQE